MCINCDQYRPRGEDAWFIRDERGHLALVSRAEHRAWRHDPQHWTVDLTPLIHPSGRALHVVTCFYGRHKRPLRRLLFYRSFFDANWFDREDVEERFPAGDLWELESWVKTLGMAKEEHWRLVDAALKQGCTIAPCTPLEAVLRG